VRGSSLKVAEKSPDYYGICPDISKKSQMRKTAISGGFCEVFGLDYFFSTLRMSSAVFSRPERSLLITSSRRTVLLPRSVSS